MISQYTPSKRRNLPADAEFNSHEPVATGLIPVQLIVPIGSRCLKIEHREDLYPQSLASLGRAIAFAADRYPNFNWVVVVQDQLHDNLGDICETVRTLIPADHRGRVAVVWVGRLTCCLAHAIHEVSLGCECQLFSSAHYGKALEWLRVSPSGPGHSDGHADPPRFSKP